jgi:hypothetical protein
MPTGDQKVQETRLRSVVAQVDSQSFGMERTHLQVRLLIPEHLDMDSTGVTR